MAADFGGNQSNRTVGGAVGKARYSPGSTPRTEEVTVRAIQMGVLHSLPCPCHLLPYLPPSVCICCAASVSPFRSPASNPLAHLGESWGVPQVPGN